MAIRKQFLDSIKLMSPDELKERKAMIEKREKSAPKERRAKIKAKLAAINAELSRS